MKNKKRKIIIIGLVTVALFAIAMGRFFLGKQQNSEKGGEAIQETLGFIPSDILMKGLSPNKITLSNTYGEVVKILGKPKTIAEKQAMYDTINAEGEGCQYLMYDSFFIILKNGRVKGWYYDPGKTDNAISNLLYIPGLKTEGESSFVALYNEWENLNFKNYTTTFLNFGKYNIGKIYFCVYNLDEQQEINWLYIYSYNTQYKLKQIYIYAFDQLVTKTIGTENLELIESNDNVETMFLGKDINYVKKYFLDARIKTDKDAVGVEGKKVHVLSFVRRNIGYRFEFSEQDNKCHLYSNSYF